MIWEEFEPCRFNVGLETVQFNAVSIVYENVFLLRYGEVGVVMQESNCK